MHAHWMKYAWQIGFGEHRAGRSSEPLHKSSLKFLSLWLWRYRETDSERDTQGKKSIMISDYRGRKSLASYTGRSLQRIMQFHRGKKHTKTTRDEHLDILFTNVTACLDSIRYDIFFTRKPASVCSPPSVKTPSAIQVDGFKYTSTEF